MTILSGANNWEKMSENAPKTLFQKESHMSELDLKRPAITGFFSRIHLGAVHKWGHVMIW